MSTSFFGDFKPAEVHHTSTVSCNGPELFEIFCPECGLLPIKYATKDLAARAAAYHNTTFKSPQATSRPAPPPWGAPQRGGFSWGKWFAAEIKL